MSSSRTVDGRFVCSVRKTSKSSGRRWDRASRRRPRRVLLALSALRQRRAQVEVERVAELVRLGRLLAVAAAAGAVEPVAAEGVPAQPREQVVEDLLADPAAAARA